MSKTNPGTGSDLIKALRCLASQDADGDCHMDKYNRYLDNCNFSKKKEAQMSCSGTSEGTIQCPYHQKTYGSFGVVLSCGVRARKALFYKVFAGSNFLSGSVKNRHFLKK